MNLLTATFHSCTPSPVFALEEGSPPGTSEQSLLAFSICSQIHTVSQVPLSSLPSRLKSPPQALKQDSIPRSHTMELEQWAQRSRVCQLSHNVMQLVHSEANAVTVLHNTHVSQTLRNPWPIVWRFQWFAILHVLAPELHISMESDSGSSFPNGSFQNLSLSQACLFWLLQSFLSF